MIGANISCAALCNFLIISCMLHFLYCYEVSYCNLFSDILWVLSRENLTFLQSNNIGADQHTLLCSLSSIVVIY